MRIVTALLLSPSATHPTALKWTHCGPISADTSTTTRIPENSARVETLARDGTKWHWMASTGTRAHLFAYVAELRVLVIHRRQEARHGDVFARLVLDSGLFHDGAHRRFVGHGGNGGRRDSSCHGCIKRLCARWFLHC
eukprot:m.608502 g.608502  ORF g.608502 m.608502 type:complete len:138 (+) comp22487_c1_seq2:81-494(+)